MLEIEQLNDAKVKVGFKKLSVRDTAIRLGISMGAYDNYNVLTRYNAVINAYEQGLSNSFIKTKKLVLEVESTYKKDHQKSVLNVSDKNNINDKINSLLSGIKEPVQIQKAYKVSPIQSVTTIKTLFINKYNGVRHRH